MCRAGSHRALGCQVRWSLAILVSVSAAFGSPAPQAAAADPAATPPPAGSKPDAPVAGSSEIHAAFKDGLDFFTSDGSFKAHIGGRVLVHYRSVFDRPDDANRTSPDAFYLRNARLEMMGQYYKDFEFRITLDAPTGTTSATTGTLQDCYLGWKHYPECAVRIGQMKVPFSLEEMMTRKTLDFNERSVANRLSHSRDLGVMVSGVIAGGLFEYEAGVFNGQGRAVQDGNDEKDVALRLRTRPFLGSDAVPCLQGLTVGVAGTIGDLDNAPVSATLNALDFYTTELNILFLDATTGTLDGIRTRLGAEVSWSDGPFGLRGEYLQRTDSVDTATENDARIASRGWYVTASWLLTGEAKSFEKAVVPAQPVDPGEGGWGAFELALRYSRLHIAHNIFDLGVASAASNSNGASVLTLGVNWYLTRNVRLCPEVIWERFDDKIAFSSRLEDTCWGLLIKAQLDF